MKASYRRRINAAVLLCVLVSCHFAVFVSPQEAKSNDLLASNSPKTLFLELRLNSDARTGEKSVKAYIINKGKTKVTLVEPGDGSESGWRTPSFSWSIIRTPWGKHPFKLSLNRYPRCGNMNPLTAKEIFDLPPGQSRELESWIDRPNLDRPGMYRVRFYYDNVPYGPWREFHSPNLLRRVRQSTPCSLISNELVFTVSKSKRAKIEMDDTEV